MGNFLSMSMLSQSFPPKSHFNPEDIPDLTGKVIIVTGGNTGIGYETIKALLPKNAKVYMASRSKDKAEAAIQKLKGETGKEAIFLQLDLASKDAVRKSAAEFKSKETELHVLFNSGGVMVPPVDQLTADGYDLQFGTNVVGHFLFTMELLPLLEAGAQSSADKTARIVNTSSSASVGYTINWEALKDTPERKKLGKELLYCQSKFANVVVSNELARRYADKGIVSTALNPGNLKTDLQRHLHPIVHYLLDLVMYTANYGALTQLWAGTSAEGAQLNGKYLIPWARVGDTRSEARDPKLGEQLWNWLVEETKTA